MEFQYAEQVVTGRNYCVRELVRLACQRFLNDLEHGPEAWHLFREDRAQHILDFFTVLFLMSKEH